MINGEATEDVLLEEMKTWNARTHDGDGLGAASAQVARVRGFE